MFIQPLESIEAYLDTMIERVCYQLWERITTVWHGTEKPELARKKTNPKGKRHRVFWPRRTHDEKKNEPDKQKNQFPPFFFLLLLFSFFGLRFPRDIASDDANDAQPKTTHNSGPCPFLPFFDAHFPLVILGIHERSIDRPTDRDGCMPAGCPSFPLILQGFQSASATQKQDQVKQSCATILLQIFCLSPLSLTPPPPFNDNLSFLRASPPGLNIWPYSNICHIHV